MSKTRNIDTKFWVDNYIINLDPSEKLLFIYFLTNEHTNICGIYELPYKIVSAETGFDKEMIDRIVKRFEKDGKIFYFDGWVILKNFIKHQKFNNNMKIGAENGFNLVPEEVWLKIKKNETLAKGFERVALSFPILESKLESESELESKLESESELESKLESEEDPLQGSELRSSKKEVKVDNRNPDIEFVMDLFEDNLGVRPISIKAKNGFDLNRSAAKWLVDKYTRDNLKTMLLTVFKAQSEDRYCRTSTNPLEFKNNLAWYKTYFEKNKQKSNSKIAMMPKIVMMPKK